jgi:hypothetical protein
MELVENCDEPVEPKVDTLRVNGLEPGEPTLERRSAR